MYLHNKLPINNPMNLHNLPKEIVKFTRESRAVTTSEVASHFKISWNTAEKYLLELVLGDKLLRLKKKGVNIWLVK